MVETHEICEREDTAKELLTAIQKIKAELSTPAVEVTLAIGEVVADMKKQLEIGGLASSLSDETRRAVNLSIRVLEEVQAVFKTTPSTDGKPPFDLIKASFNKYIARTKKDAQGIGKHLSNVFDFCEEVFPNGQELLILVTELTTCTYTARHIAHYGCDAYFKHNKELLFYERQQELIVQLEELKIE